MNRGERRDVNKRKWLSRLKLWFNKEQWKGLEMQKPSGAGVLQIDNIQDFQKTHYALKMKKSDTLSTMKAFTEKDTRSRNLANRKVDESKISEMPADKLAWEFQCGTCDFFPGDVFGTPMGYDAESEAKEGKAFSCPFANKFQHGELDCESYYKNFGCNHYWN